MTKKERLFNHLDEYYEELYADIESQTEIARLANEKADLNSTANTLRDYVRIWLKMNAPDHPSIDNGSNEKSKSEDGSNSESSDSDESSDDDDDGLPPFSKFVDFENINEQEERKWRKRKQLYENIGQNLEDWHFVSTDQARKKVEKPEEHMFCVYNLEREIYYFNFPYKTNVTNVTATFEQVQRMIEAYVYWGQKMTRKQVTRMVLDEEDFASEFGSIIRDIKGNPIRFEHTKRMFKALGIDKNSLPVAPHRHRTMTRDEIIGEWREKDEAYIEKKKFDTDAEHWKSRYEDEVQKRMDIRRILEEVAGEMPTGDIRINVNPIDMPDKEDDDGLDIVMMVTDWHVGAVSNVKNNEYNKEVFRQRVEILKGKVRRWIENYGREVNQFWMAIGGDILDGPNGNMRPGHQSEQDLHYNEQTRMASRKLAEVISFVRGILPNEVPIHIKAVGGNHGRGTSDRLDSPARAIELATYQISEGLTEDLPNLEWDITREIFHDWLITSYDITTQILLTHGDQNKRDYKRHIEALMDKRAHYHLLLQGHKHHESTEEDLDKLGVQGGALQGNESHGLHRLAVGSRSSQRLMIVDNEGPKIPGQLITG